MAQRVIAAHDAWREAHDTARRFDGRCAANGTGLFLNLSIFIHELVHDEDLCKRLVQHFEKELRADFPPAQGKML
jgi:hypothetical protein